MKWLLGVILLALAGTACAGDTSSDDAARGSSGEQTTEASQIDLAECEDEAGELFDALNGIDSRLDIGLNVSEFGELLGDAKVEYDQIDFSAAVSACRQAVVQAEKAFNNYITSYNKWQNCIESTSCDTDNQPAVQELWSKASDRLDKARQLLNAAS